MSRSHLFVSFVNCRLISNAVPIIVVPVRNDRGRKRKKKKRKNDTTYRASIIFCYCRNQLDRKRPLKVIVHLFSSFRRVWWRIPAAKRIVLNGTIRIVV